MSRGPCPWTSDLPSSALLEFPVPFLAAVGGAVLFSAIVFGPDLGPSPNDAPRSKPPSPKEPVIMRPQQVPRPGTGGLEEITAILAFLIPRAGGKAPPEGVEAEMKAAMAEKLRREYDLADAEVGVLLPGQWLGDPVPSKAALLDADARETYADAFSATLRAAGCGEGVAAAVLDSVHDIRDMDTVGMVILSAKVKALRAEFGALLTRGPKIEALTESRPAAKPATLVCDICATPLRPLQMISVNPKILQGLTDKGFVPRNLPQIFLDEVTGDVTLADVWKLTVRVNDSDWGVCQQCADDIDRFAHDE